MNRRTPDPAPSAFGGLGALVEGTGAILVFVGAYAPWAGTFFLFASTLERGVDATCLMTSCRHVLPLVPLVTLGLLAWGWYIGRTKWVHLVILILGVLTLALSANYVVTLKRNVLRAEQSLARAGQLPGTVRVVLDVGFYLTVAGGVAMVAGGLLGRRQDRPSRGRA